MVLGQGVTLTDIFSADLLTALSLTACQLQTLSQAEWLAADKPKARVLLGLSDGRAGRVSLAGQRGAFCLWSCLCRYYLDH